MAEIASHVGDAGLKDWRHADARLRDLASRRAALDAEEARWLLIARRAGVHRELGFSTFAEYMERVLGHRPHAAAERMRVAEALERLPATRHALATGQQSYSAVRELTRVATAETEAEWLARAAGRTVRDIESMVAGRKEGDQPGDPPDPDKLRHRVMFEVSGPTLALLRDARRALEDETGERLDDDQLVAALCRAALGGPDDAGRAAHQVAITVCERCDRGWQDGAGAAIEVPSSTIERAQCDAQRVGRLDSTTPARATQDIPPSVRRLVWRRDHGRCAVPGCRSARYLEVHHVVRRADGGAHTADNCLLACGAHHHAIHDGKLIVTGTIATGLSFAHADGRPYGQPPFNDGVFDDAVTGLRQLGFSASESRAAVDIARSHVGPTASLKDVVRRALAACRLRSPRQDRA